MRASGRRRALSAGLYIATGFVAACRGPQAPPVFVPAPEAPQPAPARVKVLDVATSSGQQAAVASMELPLAGPVNVTMLVNVAVLRAHPAGGHVAPFFRGWPLGRLGLNSPAGVDPLQRLDWVFVFGPALAHTERDALVVHHAIGDDVVDSALSKDGEPITVGATGAKAWRLPDGDGAQAALRLPGHVVAIVPRAQVTAFADLLTKRSLRPALRSDEAIRLTLRSPSKQLAIPSLKLDPSVSELRAWATLRTADGGADLYVEADCTDEEAARSVAAELNGSLAAMNNPTARIVTGTLLNGASFGIDGQKVSLHLDASPSQLERILQATVALLISGSRP